MDRHDPNQWTKEFVVNNKDFCIGEIKDFNKLIIKYLQEGEHQAVIAGLDRVLNGLVTMINAGYDYRSHVCLLSWVEANVMLFGNLQEFAEENRINTAKQALLDARDFAKSDTVKNNTNAIVDDINNGYDLAALRAKYEEDFPNAEIDTIIDINNRLDNDCTTVAPVSVTNISTVNTKKKPWWIIIVIILLVVGVIAYFMTQEKTTEAPMREEKVRVSQVTNQDEATENTSEKVSENTPEIPEEETTEAKEEVNIVGSWVHVQLNEGRVNPDGEKIPDFRSMTYYTFYDNGRYSVGGSDYEEANENEQAYAEKIDGRYWICVGGGAQEGNYTINGNQIILVTDDNMQYGPSTTSTKTFTLNGNTLTIPGPYGTTVYKRSDNVL